MPSNTEQRQVQQVQTTLPPEFQEGLGFVLDEAQALQGLPLVPSLSGQTQQAIGQLGAIDPTAQATLLETAQGGVVNPQLEAVSDFVADRAAREVSDVFTASGRTGSPAQQEAISEAVTSAISPFAFQNIENERARQLNAALQLQNLQQQGARGQLLGGQILDQQARAELLEPFQRLGLITSPIVSAVSGAPITQTTTQPFTKNTGANVLGGAATGFQLGNSISPGIGGVIGGIGGGILGLF